MRTNLRIISYIAFAAGLCAYSVNAADKNTGLVGLKYVKGSAGYTASSYKMIGEMDFSDLGLSKETDIVCAVENQGFTPEIALGYYFTNSIRAELAFSTSFLIIKI